MTKATTLFFLKIFLHFFILHLRIYFMSFVIIAIKIHPNKIRLKMTPYSKHITNYIRVLWLSFYVKSYWRFSFFFSYLYLSCFSTAVDKILQLWDILQIVMNGQMQKVKERKTEIYRKELREEKNKTLDRTDIERDTNEWQSRWDII